MRRRAFMAYVGGTAIAWPLRADAQQTVGRVYRVGYFQIASREEQLHLINAFEDALRRLGYRVGETPKLVISRRRRVVAFPSSVRTTASPSAMMSPPRRKSERQL